jgi:hypothetical protein
MAYWENNNLGPSANKDFHYFRIEMKMDSDKDIELDFKEKEDKWAITRTAVKSYKQESKAPSGT